LNAENQPPQADPAIESKQIGQPPRRQDRQENPIQHSPWLFLGDLGGYRADFFPRRDLITSVSSRQSQNLKWRKIHVASKCRGDAAASPAYAVDFEPVGAAVHSCGGGAGDS
jgi:hypothetical protein